MYNTIQQDLQQAALVRLPQIIGSKKDGITPLLPISRSSWLVGVRDGIYPQPVKLGTGRAVAWRQKDLIDLLNELGESK